MQETEGLRKRAAAPAAEEQQRQASYYNARRREVNYEIGDLIIKRNRVLSSAAQGISAKLAPKYAGPLKITEITGSNTVRVIDERDGSEETLHVSHLKPYNDEGSDGSGEEADDGEDAQPPREETSVPVMNNPPEVGVAPPSDARQTEKRPRGRPQKTVRVVKRTIPRKAHATTGATVETKKTRGRPKGSTKRVEPKVNRDLSPRTTRAQRRAMTSGQSMSSGVANDSD